MLHRRSHAMKVHAIYAVLNDLHLFRASLASIYDHVDGVTVTTGYDRDWLGAEYPPEGIVEEILSRENDPDRKIDLIVGWEPNESRTRNRAMDFADPSRRSRRVIVQHKADRAPVDVDYFWIIDADEIYDGSNIEDLKGYVSEGRRPYYQVPAVQYFKSWNYRVEGYEWFTAFVRSDRRLGSSRNPFPSNAFRLAHKMRLPHLANRAVGLERIPPEVGIFHHGTYVGPRTRIESKLKNSSHSHLMRPYWLEDVWDHWQPDSRDFHPVEPSAMSSALRVPSSALPKEITGRPWPEGYFDELPLQ